MIIILKGGENMFEIPLEIRILIDYLDAQDSLLLGKEEQESVSEKEKE